MKCSSKIICTNRRVFIIVYKSTRKDLVYKALVVKGWRWGTVVMDKVPSLHSTLLIYRNDTIK